MIVQLTRRYVVYTLFKRWKVFALFFTACVLMAGLFIALVPWRYESSAQLVVKVGAQDVSDINITAPPGQQMTQPAYGDVVREVVNTQLDILKSADVTRATLQKVGIAKVYPGIAKSPPAFFGTPIAPIDAANERMEKDLTVSSSPDSNTLHVSLLNADPAVAQQTLRTLIAVFTAKDSEVMRNPRANFLEKQAEDARAKVNAAQNALLEYKRENKITSLDQERSLLLTQRDLLEQDLSAENTQSLQQSVTAAHNLLATAQQRYLQAQQTYAPGNPMLEDARASLALVRQQYDALMRSLANNSTGPRGLNPVGSNSPSAAAANNALINLWTKQLKFINERLDHLDQAEGGLLNLQRELAVASQDYTTFMQRTANARVTEALNQQGIPSIAISQDPTLPYKPARPRMVLIMGLAGVLGLIGGLGLCFFLEAVSETIGLPEQVEPLTGLPVVSVVNRNRGIKKGRAGSRWRPDESSG